MEMALVQVQRNFVRREMQISQMLRVEVSVLGHYVFVSLDNDPEQMCSALNLTTARYREKFCLSIEQRISRPLRWPLVDYLGKAVFVDLLAYKSSNKRNGQSVGLEMSFKY